MPKTIRNEYYKQLLYEKLMEAHLKARKGKTYKHSGYTSFYITEPKVRKIEKSKYIDRKD